MEYKLSPSILAADFANLGADVQKAYEAGAGGILGRGMGRKQTIRYKGRRRERKIVRQTGTSKGTDSKEIAKENVGF